MYPISLWKRYSLASHIDSHPLEYEDDELFLKVHGDNLFLNPHANDKGRELWSLNTSDNKLSIIKDLNEGSGSSNPSGSNHKYLTA